VTKSNYLNTIHSLGLDQLLTGFLTLATNLAGQSDELSYLATEQGNNQKELAELRSQVKATVAEIVHNRVGKLITETFTENSEFKVENVNALLEMLSACLEIVSHVALVFAASTAASRVVKLVWHERTKRSKKKKTTYLKYAQAVDAVYEVYEALCQLVNGLHVQLKFAVCPWVASKCESAVSVASGGSQLSDVAQSYQKSFEELRGHFAGKLKYLLRLSSNAASGGLATSLENLKLN
jgi:hypothetical protein